MKRFLVSATTAAVLSVLSSGAFAQVSLDDGSGAKKYAKELVVAGSSALAGTAVDVTSKLGFGVSGGQTRFIRYDLTNAKFLNAVDPADLSIAAPNFANVVVSQGGGAGDSYVIFQVTADPAGSAQSALVTFAVGSALPTPPSLVIQSAAASVQMAYSLYETGAAAAAGGAAGRLNSNFAAQTVASLTSGLSFTTATNKTTVSVAASPAYSKFLQGVTGTSTTIAQIGTVSIGASGALKLDGSVAVYTDFVAAGTTLVLKGDFTGAVTPSTANTGLFLGTDNGDCGTGNLAPTPATPVGGAAVFPTNTTPAVNKPLCFTIPAANTTAITAQTFTVEADITPAGTSTTADQPPIDAGTFVRDGLVLKAAFAETTGVSGVSRAVSLSNTSNLPAPYTVRCLVNSATVVNGNPGTVAAGGSTRLSLGTPGLGCPTNGTLRGVQLTFQAVPGAVVGSVVSQSLSTGAASYDGMTGNQ